MAPTIEKIAIPPNDINRDGTLDDIESGLVPVSGDMEDGGHYIGVALASHIPHLNNPDPEDTGYIFDRFEACAVPGIGADTTPWFIRELRKANAVLNPWVRFRNLNLTMSFTPGDKVILPDFESPQTILGIVVLVNEKTDTFEKTVYAQLDLCHLVSVDQLAMVTAGGDRLDMDRVDRLMAEKTLKDTTVSEKHVASMLKDIKRRFADRIEIVRNVDSKDRLLAAQQLRREVFMELQKLNNNLEGLPTQWENGALTLIGLPVMSQEILAQQAK